MVVTVPCQTLGQGTYAIVKEAVEISTGKYYACKVINKKLMEGREHMIRNEIAVLKRVSQGNKNVVTLHDYFETQNNLYLVTDLCLGGELFDRICAKGSYYESDAAALVRTITSAVQYLHANGVVHRDLKPENLLFLTPDESSDLLIADFGLSKMIDDYTYSALTTTCGTPGYMAPEVFKKTGHGKPVDIWAIGVITYFLLCGYTPFDRDDQVQEIQAICAADYSFTPEEYWHGVSDVARDFIKKCLTIDQTQRLTATQALEHPWLKVSQDVAATQTDLLPTFKRAFDPKRTFKRAILTVRAAAALKDGGEQVLQRRNSTMNDAERQLYENVQQALKQSEQEADAVDQVLAP